MGLKDKHNKEWAKLRADIVMYLRQNPEARREHVAYLFSVSTRTLDNIIAAYGLERPLGRPAKGKEL